MANLYLDVDGVLLTTRHTQTAEGVAEFVDFVTTHFHCFWLTTHCKGNAATALRYVQQFLPAPVVDKLALACQPTNWQTLKTEAIDFATGFYRLDDNPLQAEQRVLKANDAAARLLLVSLDRPNELLRVQKLLRFKLGLPALATFTNRLTAQVGERGTPAREAFKAGGESFKLGNVPH